MGLLIAVLLGERNIFTAYLEWQDEWGTKFEMSLEALQQGWDYPPLVQILQGNIPTEGLWTGLVPDYAENLTLIRLKLLENQERNPKVIVKAIGDHFLSSHPINEPHPLSTEASFQANAVTIWENMGRTRLRRDPCGVAIP